ncbi:25326_t:CDS:2 [Dentiscutata erythropus]|uniref:25326_t:CDS:1 n=1 Tax=Dentiscutata erythropus TaxID=1348616 RepID=A0A9N9HH64_9GLOM|nr:25326_t:CDS:2 [Dentiscutata erythropus]
MCSRKDLLDERVTTLFRNLNDEQAVVLEFILGILESVMMNNESQTKEADYKIYPNNTKDFKYDKDANIDTHSGDIDIKEGLFKIITDNANSRSYEPEFEDPVLDIIKSYFEKETLNKKLECLDNKKGEIDANNKNIASIPDKTNSPRPYDQNEDNLSKDNCKVSIHYQKATENNEKSDNYDQGDGITKDIEIVEKAEKFINKVKNILNETKPKELILTRNNKSLQVRCDS